MNEGNKVTALIRNAKIFEVLLLFQSRTSHTEHLSFLFTYFRPEASIRKTSAGEDEEVKSSTAGSEDGCKFSKLPAVEDVVLTQPGLGVTTTTITTITQTGGNWSTGLFNIWGDKTTCNTSALHRMNTVGTHLISTTCEI